MPRETVTTGKSAECTLHGTISLRFPTKSIKQLTKSRANQEKNLTRDLALKEQCMCVFICGEDNCSTLVTNPTSASSFAS